MNREALAIPQDSLWSETHPSTRPEPRTQLQPGGRVILRTGNAFKRLLGSDRCTRKPLKTALHCGAPVFTGLKPGATRFMAREQALLEQATAHEQVFGG